MTPLKYDPSITAVVMIDPQNDVLSPTGKSWDAVQDSVVENGTVEHLVAVCSAAKTGEFPVFVSPHYFYPTDHDWLFNGPLESDELHDNTFARSGALSLDGFAGSGADWLDRLRPFIEDPTTVVASPHKVWGPQTNDLVLQLRKRAITNVILCGMLANMCVESHLRDLLEQGFQVTVVRDATAGPRHPTRGDGYQAALVNYAFLAHEVVYTKEVVAAMKSPRR
ncbi:cysteine hydrolase [Mycobacterium simiae]|uniref:cysteine hydrolase n=1 Tax=Mycobacterium simiae TaxID=1784 RepID=UPI0005C99294|nr:cysteine hydrolase [Mycobacterium simiae]PLV44846.1 isochorismatase [Mycobacterium tuberculosis variant microti OV254]BBX38823.1 isochorismatase [Mycobacterium simiae]